MATTVRITPQTHAKLKALAEQSGESLSAVLERAVETYRRQQFLDQANQAYATLRADSEAWAEELEERDAWDATVADGQEAD